MPGSGVFHNCAKELIPEFRSSSQAAATGPDPDTAEPGEPLHPVGALTEKEINLIHFSWLKIDMQHQRRAGVEAGSYRTRKTDAPQRPRARAAPEPAQEFVTIGSQPVKRFAPSRKRHPFSELGVVGVPRQERLALPIELGDDVLLAALPVTPRTHSA
jgi:hypothetical protein